MTYKFRYILAATLALLAAAPASAQVCTYTEQNGATKNCIKVEINTTTAGTGASAQQKQGTAANGGTPTGNPNVVAGSDGTNVRTLKTDAAGNLTVRGADSAGSSPTANGVRMAGTDTGGLIRALKTDTDGSMINYGGRTVFATTSSGAVSTLAYTAGANVGGLITINTGLPAGTALSACHIVLGSNTVSALGTLSITLFDANPSGSTFTDASAQVIANADVAKVAASTAAPANTFGTTGVTLWNYANAQCPRVVVGASGNLWLAVTAPAGAQFSATTALSVRFDGLY